MKGAFGEFDFIQLLAQNRFTSQNVLVSQASKLQKQVSKLGNIVFTELHKPDFSPDHTQVHSHNNALLACVGETLRMKGTLCMLQMCSGRCRTKHVSEHALKQLSCSHY